MAAGRFSLKVYQRRHVPVGAEEVHAVVVVEATGLVAHESAGHPAAEVIVLDRSLSMDWPPGKMDTAVEATHAAIDALRDGVHFAVVAGHSAADVVYPGAGRPLAVASRLTREEAKLALRHLRPSGSTVIGSWLIRARDLLLPHRQAVRHVFLFTDGKNEQQKPEDLDTVLDTCRGSFGCDPRGIGTDWDAEELHRIASAFHGTARAVAPEADMAAEFRTVMEDAMGKTLPEVRLVVQTMPGARLDSLTQVHPTTADIARLLEHRGESTTVLPLGPWGDERRAFHLCIAIRQDCPTDEERAAAWVALELPPEETSQALLPPECPVTACWTAQEARYAAPDPAAFLLDQEELARLVWTACDALTAAERSPDEPGYRERLDAAAAAAGRAVAMAHRLGRTDLLEQLEHLVEVDDAAEGRVRLRTDIARLDISRTQMTSVHTRVRADSEEDAGTTARQPSEATGAAPGRRCGRCDWLNPPDARSCEGCAHPFDVEPGWNGS